MLPINVDRHTSLQRLAISCPSLFDTVCDPWSRALPRLCIHLNCRLVAILPRNKTCSLCTANTKNVLLSKAEMFPPESFWVVCESWHWEPVLGQGIIHYVCWGAKFGLNCLAYSCRQNVLGGLWTGIRPTQITIASKMVKDFTGVMIQPHKVQATPSLHLPATSLQFPQSFSN